MVKPTRRLFLTAALAAATLAAWQALPSVGQDLPAEAPPPAVAPAADAAPAVVHLTLEEAKQRALAASKLLALAGMNIQSKEYATKAMRANYFPQVLGNSVYFHFNEPLGEVLATPGRTVHGPRNRPLLTFPPQTVEIPLINQNSQFSTVYALQPITDLLKVRQGVKIARANEQIAAAELEKGTRELMSGVSQLYWGLLAAQRIRAGAVESVRGAEQLAKLLKTVEVRLALAEAKQGLQQVEAQIADLQEQMNALLDLPPCTMLVLVEPPLPEIPYRCADEVVSLALAASPEIRQADQDIVKAQAAVCAAKVDYLPNLALVGGYANNTMIDPIQQNIGYMGAVGSYTFVDWHKRKNTIRERKMLIGMATLKVQQTQDEVRQKAVKAFREVGEGREALQMAQEMVQLRKEAEKKAGGAAALRDPDALLKATKNRMLAEADVVKADLAYRTAVVKLMTLTGAP